VTARASTVMGHVGGEAGVAPAASNSKSVATSVIVCAWTEDRWDDIVAAVEATLAQQPAPLEVLVVVDHNPTLAGRLRAYLPHIRVLDNTGARGLSGARDTGIAAASGDVVAFLDDDACPRPGWLAALTAPFGADSAVTMAGGRVEPNWDGGAPGWVPEEFGWVFGCSYRGLPTTAATVRNPIGASMAVRLTAARAIGPFAGDLGRVGSDTGGCEETEYAIRAAETLPGSRVAYEPTSVVDHRVPRSRANVGYFVRRCTGEGRSKARLARRAGPQAALASERTYLTRTLPTGVLHRLAHPTRWSQAVMLVVGVAATGYGYVAERMTHGRKVPVAA
jgi:cellulose synthase/poly-beta-1,6-N-acetylglucosamine synthase-like glycosyltransferase